METPKTALRKRAVTAAAARARTHAHTYTHTPGGRRHNKVFSHKWTLVHRAVRKKTKKLFRFIKVGLVNTGKWRPNKNKKENTFPLLLMPAESKHGRVAPLEAVTVRGVPTDLPSTLSPTRIKSEHTTCTGQGPGCVTKPTLEQLVGGTPARCL